MPKPLYDALGGAQPAPDMQQPAPGVPPAPAGPGMPGPMSAAINGGDPAFDAWRQANPHVPEVVAKQAYEAYKSHPAGNNMPAMNSGPAPTPYANYANKATGKEYK